METSNSNTVSNNQVTNKIAAQTLKNKFVEQHNKTVITYQNLPFPITSTPVQTTTKNLHTFMTPTSSTNNDTPCNPSNKLNNFLLGQLIEKRLNGELAPMTTTTISNNGFILPQLQLSTQQNSRTAGLVLPNLSSNENREQITGKLSLPNLLVGKNTEEEKTTTGDGNISGIDKALSGLKVDNEDSLKKKNSIDLTSALSSTKTCNDYNFKLSKNFAHTQKTTEQFNIPFIDCDLPQTSNKYKINIVPNAPNVNEYCQTDISHIVYKHSLFHPSPFGRVICLNYKRKASLRKASLIIVHKCKVKHRITPFLFDTQSPDDKVLAALSKYHRQN